MKEDVEQNFGFHLVVIKDHLYEEKTIVARGVTDNQPKVISPLLNYKQLLDEQCFFKMMMIASTTKVLGVQELKPRVMNPMTRL